MSASPPYLLRLLALATLPLAPGWSATVTLTDAAADYYASSPGPCAPGAWPGCGAYGYLSYSNTLGATNYFTDSGRFNTQPVGEETFLSAFANWNSTQGQASQWTLAFGGSLGNLDLNISRFDTFADNNTGGVEIRVDVVPGATYAGPALDELYWVQALLINYTPGSNDPNMNQNVMDEYQFNINTVPGGGCRQPGAAAPPNSYCGPVYPYQYGDRHFSDRPTGIYPIDSFRGIALLSTVNTTTRTLTWYEGGVNYGFDLFVVPEPGTWLLTGSALAFAFWRRSTRAAGNG